MKAMPPAVVPDENKVNYVQFCDVLLHNIKSLTSRFTKYKLPNASLMRMRTNLFQLSQVLKQIAGA
jgi:hypothetical protein